MLMRIFPHMTRQCLQVFRNAQEFAKYTEEQTRALEDGWMETTVSVHAGAFKHVVRHRLGVRWLKDMFSKVDREHIVLEPCAEFREDGKRVMSTPANTWAWIEAAKHAPKHGKVAALQVRISLFQINLLHVSIHSISSLIYSVPLTTVYSR